MYKKFSDFSKKNLGSGTDQERSEVTPLMSRCANSVLASLGMQCVEKPLVVTSFYIYCANIPLERKKPAHFYSLASKHI